jgi:hypothetical protein
MTARGIRGPELASAILDADPRIEDARESSYRRGAHQAVAMLATELSRIKTLSAARQFADRLADKLSDFRGEIGAYYKSHPDLVAEAISAVKRK